MPQKKQFGLKRRRETSATPSPRKKPRVSPRNSREEPRVSRLRSLRENTKSYKKDRGVPNREVRAHRDEKPPNKEKERRPEENMSASVEKERLQSLVENEGRAWDKIPTNVDKERRDLSAAEKENSPLTEKDVVNELRSNENSAVTSGNTVVPCPPIAAPSLPALLCPTLFSARMYKRMYGKDPVSVAGSEPPRETIPPTVVNEPSKSLSWRSHPQSQGSTNQLFPASASSSRRLSRVTREDIKAYIEKNELDSDSSCSKSSVLQFTCKPVLTSYVKPQDRTSEAFPKVTPTGLQPQSCERPHPPKTNEPNLQQATVDFPTQLKSLENAINVSSHLKADQSYAKPVAKGELLEVAKLRQQTVAAIRPMQSAAQENPKPNEKSDKNSLVSHDPNSVKNSPETKSVADSNVCSSEKSSRLKRIPGFPGSAKGRTVRRVFAPISNQWSHSQPSEMCINNPDEKENSEISTVKTVSVTSELTVRVDDTKEDEMKRQLLFGSPVKWADDSLDSPKTEKSTHSRRMYSFFGSPCIDRSNSSEHPFCVPTEAFEDSCWTNSDKIPSKQAGENDLQKHCGKIPESVPDGENKPKEKSLELNDIAKGPTGSSICPPPSVSVLKKHVSIFSPLKDSKQSMTSRILDEPSRSNTGVCFPFTRPRYEDSVLGQFDDTAQFVSALAKVDTRISPLSTPVKGEEGRDAVSSTVENNLTSFQEVFKKNGSDEVQENREFPHPVSTDPNIAERPPNLIVSDISGKEHEAGIPSQSVQSKHSKGSHQSESCNTAVAGNSESHKCVEPPTITITPPKTKSSLRIIHRPNFASSTILGVKSWFPNAPIKLVTPRKTPRLVSGAKCSTSPKGLEVPGAKIAIADAFIIQQEERVRRWELDHLYENTIRSGSGSPLKSVNGSPNRKRIESPSKISPSKRSPKKQGPCKSARDDELHKNHFEYPLNDNTPVSHAAIPEKSYVAQSSPNSANQKAVPVDVISCPTFGTAESLADPTEKLLTMLSGVMEKTKQTERVDCFSKEAYKPEGLVGSSPAAPSTVSSEAQVEGKRCHIDQSGGINLNPSKSTLENTEHSQGAMTNDLKSISNSAVDLSLENFTNQQVGLATSHAVSQSQPPSTPLQFNDKAENNVAIDASIGLVDDNPQLSTVSAEEKAVISLGSSKLISPKPSKSCCEIRQLSVPTKKPGKSMKRSNASCYDVPTGPHDLLESDCHASLPSRECAKSTSVSTNVKVTSNTKYGAIISRVRPSTPLNKSVAALIKSSFHSAASPSKPLLTINTPGGQSVKTRNFKRSSALKSSTEKGAGNSLMNSIRSTFFQGTPTSSSSSKTDRTRITPKPSRFHGKRYPNLSVNSKNNVSTPTSTAPSSLERNPEPKMDMNIPVRWKLIEVDSPKPISLLNRFRKSKEGSERLESPLASKSGAQLTQDSGNHPPESPILPRSCLRKTILLDTPLKMLTPTKGKIQNVDLTESLHPPYEKRANPKLGDLSRTRTADSERAEPGTKPNNDPVPERYSRNHHSDSSRKRSSSAGVSSKRSRHSDDSLTPRRRRKSHSAYHFSPEQSPDKESTNSSSKNRKSKVEECNSFRSSGRKTPSDRTCSNGSDRISKSKSRQSENITPESTPKCPLRKTPSGKESSTYRRSNRKSRRSETSSSESESPEASGRKFSQSSDRMSKLESRKHKSSSSESSGRRPRTPSADSGRRSSKMSFESAGNSKIISTDCSNITPVMRVSHSKTAPVVDSASRAVPTPIIGIRKNRTANFSASSTTTPTEIVISMGD